MKLLIALSLLILIDVPKVRKDLQAITTQQQAKAYLSSSGLKGRIMELDQLQDSSAIAIRLFNLKAGDIIEQSAADASTTYLYKLLSVAESPADRVQYIYFDGSKLAKKSIDSIRAVVMNKLKGGASFTSLAKEYSMDQNARRGGDSGWFDKDSFVGGFVTAVRSHSKGDVFTVDIPAQKWYYVVHKSHNAIRRKKITAFYVAVPVK